MLSECLGLKVQCIEYRLSKIISQVVYIGDLVAAGRHEELLNSCTTYANLVSKQLGGDLPTEEDI